MPHEVERSAVWSPSNTRQSLQPSTEKTARTRFLANRWVLLGFAVVAAWLLVDAWNGAWTEGYRSGRCEAKCGFAADRIEFVSETQQIVCTCRDGKVWRLSQ
jgi:hypothetical protein